MSRSFNTALFLGGIFGLLAIAVGAYADHVLKSKIAPQDFESLETAVRYQFLHSVMLVMIGFNRSAGATRNATRIINCAAFCFASGIIFFSGGILAHVMCGSGFALHFAPIGGVAFMLGWILLAVRAFI